jgi:hypothetical protein
MSTKPRFRFQTRTAGGSGLEPKSRVRPRMADLRLPRRVGAPPSITVPGIEPAPKTEPSGEASRTELRPLSHGEVARLVRQAELMRAEHVAWLFRSLGRGVARGAVRLAHALAARPAPAGSSPGVAGRP